MARGAFQNDNISDHIDGLQFKTTISAPSERERDLSSKGMIKSLPSWAVYKTYMSLDKVLITSVFTVMLVHWEVKTFCGGTHAPSPSPTYAPF